MILTRTERIYKELHKTWYKHGKFDKDTHAVIKNRVTWKLFMIPIFWYEKITNTTMQYYR